MPLPKKVLNRLRLGREVAARVAASLPNNLGWVYVYPILDPENGSLIVGYGGEEQFVAIGEGNPIKGFLVRHLEIEEQVAEEYYQSRRDDVGNPASDERIVATTEEELETILQRWITDFLTLRVPSGVGYLFERGPNLID